MDNINMENNKYITVLDFEMGSVFQYEISYNEDNLPDMEEYLGNKGHNLSNCEWMVHDNKEIIRK